MFVFIMGLVLIKSWKQRLSWELCPWGNIDKCLPHLIGHHWQNKVWCHQSPALEPNEFIEVIYRAWVSIAYRNVSIPRGVTPLKGLTLSKMMTYPYLHRWNHLPRLCTPESPETAGLCTVGADLYTVGKNVQSWVSVISDEGPIVLPTHSLRKDHQKIPGLILRVSFKQPHLLWLGQLLWCLQDIVQINIHPQ